MIKDLQSIISEIHVGLFIIIGICFTNSSAFAQNLIKNGTFNSNLSYWNNSQSVCPTISSPSWSQYSVGLIPDYPTDWEGTAFLKNKAANDQSTYLTLGQNIAGLLPANGNSVEVSMDLILGEAYNINLSNLPAEYLDDNITLEVWLGGTKYASVRTPSGWYSSLGGDFGGCLVNYFNGASSINYLEGNSMNNISNEFINGDFPHYTPVSNANWDISIPWDCGKSISALFEIKVLTNSYLGKSILDTRGQSYSQTCVTNNYSNLDNVAFDNVVIKNKFIVSTPQLSIANLTSSYCSQTIFNLLSAVNPLPSCPLADPNSLEYCFFEDSDLTIPIDNPSTFTVSNSEQSVYIVLGNKVNEATGRIMSNIKRELKIKKNELSTAGLIGSPYELCSNVNPTELTNIIAPTGVTGASITYFWEKSIGSFDGPYTAATGDISNLDYLPTGLTTANEVVTDYYFRRTTKTTLNDLTCQLSTAPVKIVVKPCAPVSNNNTFEYLNNPGGNNSVNIPVNLFSSTALIGSINSIRLTKFPVKATSLTINTTSPGARTAASITYCGNPAAAGCVGTTFPTAGVLLPTNLLGNPINTNMSLDPLNGSILVSVPYVSIDTRGFVSTVANASLQFGNGGALPIQLSKFEVEKAGFNTVNLNWQTESEINFSHFEIESALNNLRFSKKTVLFPNESKLYSSQISDLENGVWYFRLKLIDLDGKYEYSPVKSYTVTNEAQNSVVIKENPSKDHIRLDLNLAKGTYHFNLLDMLGKNILAVIKYVNGFEYDFLLNQKPLQGGIYFLQITDEATKFVSNKKIILK